MIGPQIGATDAAWPRRIDDGRGGSQQVSNDVFFGFIDDALIVCCLGGNPSNNVFFLGSLIIFSILRGLGFDRVRSLVASLEMDGTGVRSLVSHVQSWPSNLARVFC